jgi:negative regulator of sigma E activity
MLKVAGGQYKTIHLVPTEQSKNQVETKELWLAAEQNYILVRFLMVDDDGAKLEQTLTELHVD